VLFLAACGGAPFSVSSSGSALELDGGSVVEGGGETSSAEARAADDAQTVDRIGPDAGAGTQDAGTNSPDVGAELDAGDGGNREASPLPDAGGCPFAVLSWDYDGGTDHVSHTTGTLCECNPTCACLLELAGCRGAAPRARP
jgi:hypothetical protein